MNRQSAVLSSGIGKLHFDEVARAAASSGVPVRLVTGWIPDPAHRNLVDFAGRLIGEKSLWRRLEPRRIESPNVELRSCWAPEAFASLAGKTAALSGFGGARVGALSFQLFGLASRRHLRDADIFHVRSGAGQGGAILTARSRQMKILVDHSIAHPATLEAALAPVYARLGMPCPYRASDAFWRVVLADCDQADVLLVNSDYVKRTFIAHGYPADRIRVLYWGVHNRFWGLKSDYTAGHPFRLIFTGHFEPRKGAHVLADAMELLRQERFPARLKVIGNTNARFMERLRGRLAGIDFLPFCPQAELGQHLSEADAFVFPTLGEGSARSAMEAMGAGLPVITTLECGVPIEDGRDGIHVPAGSAEALAAAIIALAGNQARRRDLGSAAAEKIRGQYTWQAFGANLRVLYESMTLNTAKGCA